MDAYEAMPVSMDFDRKLWAKIDAEDAQPWWQRTWTHVLEGPAIGWASFLFNFWQHWHPSAASQAPGTVGTSVFRRDLVGSRPLRIHQFEELILGRRGPVVNGFPVNHIQVTPWWKATARVFDNGRVSGSAIRRNSLSPSRTLKDAVSWAVGGRNREIALVLRDHPRAAELPSGTIWRVRWIALCHSAGAIFGALFGSGRAQKRLE